MAVAWRQSRFRMRCAHGGLDHGQQGHTVNIVSPGPYASRAAKSIGDIGVMIDETASRSPLQRAITAQDVANTVLFLCSTLASSITGEVITVDAGFQAMGT